MNSYFVRKYQFRLVIGSISLVGPIPRYFCDVVVVAADLLEKPEVDEDAGAEIDSDRDDGRFVLFLTVFPNGIGFWTPLFSYVFLSRDSRDPV